MSQLSTGKSKIMSKRIELTSEDGVTIATLKDHSLTDELIIHELIEELIQLIASREHPKLAIDFSGVGFLGTHLLGRLISVKKSATQHGTRLKLCSLSENIAEVFQLVCFDRVFDICPSKVEAVRAWNNAV
jgi:anti-anti-sigma factor